MSFTFNKNNIERDLILFGSFDSSKYFEKIRHFDNLSISNLNKLIEFNFINQNETDNCFLSANDFYKFAESIIQYCPEVENNLFFTGYLVCDSRINDCRITINGCRIINKNNIFSHNVLALFTTYFKFADKFNIDLDSEMICWYDA